MGSISAGSYYEVNQRRRTYRFLLSCGPCHDDSNTVHDLLGTNIPDSGIAVSTEGSQICALATLGNKSYVSSPSLNANKDLVSYLWVKADALHTAIMLAQRTGTAGLHINDAQLFSCDSDVLGHRTKGHIIDP